MSVPRASAFDRSRNLVPKFELLQDVLDVWGEAVEIRFEISPKLLLAGPCLEIPQSELRGVVECVSGSFSQRPILMVDLSNVELRLQL